jgi:hypothetical protein
VLVVVPEHDLQVPPQDGTTICELVPASCETVNLPGVSHILRDDPDRRGPRYYRKALNQPVSPDLLGSITAWVAGQHSSNTSQQKEIGQP